MNKFRKKPVVVEAMQFDGSPTQARAILEWMVGEDWHMMSLESMRVEPGDWVIKGIKGEFYPCKPDIFAATYEPVVEDDSNEVQVDTGAVMSEGKPVTWCQMSYTSEWPNKRWTCRYCGKVVIRDGSDGHPVERCSNTKTSKSS